MPTRPPDQPGGDRADPAGDGLRTVTIELGELRGKLAIPVLVDEAPDAHLDVVWLWP